MLHHTLGARYGATDCFTHKNFRHVTSSTGEPSVETPYRRPDHPFKGRTQ
jgi:hypothetical protein